MEVEYRKLTEKELDTFIDMRIIQLREEGVKEDIDIKSSLRDYYERHMADGTFVSWLAFDGDKIIGTSGMSFVEKPPYFGCPNGKIGLLSSMFTSREYRRQGIGKELLARVVNEAKEYGCGVVQITASDMGDAFRKIFHAIHRTKNEGVTYLDWLASIKVYCETNQLSTEWTNKAKLAHSICLDIFGKYSERVLLHGDLHHDNILQRMDGSYAMIDPKGVVGPPILDLPRFILNEMAAYHEEPLKEHIMKVMEMISQQFGYPLEDVARIFVMEIILANIWCIEDGEDVDLQQLGIAEYLERKSSISFTG